MNSPTVSIVGSLALGVAGIVIGWLASHNIVPAADVDKDTALVATAIVGAFGAGVAWFKAGQATQGAMIHAVNAADNGVKVVPDSAVAPTVNQPLRGK